MLHPSATQKIIAVVYRQLAKQYHPDHSGPSSQARMAEINEAYAILSDRQKRARYDEMIGVSRDGEIRGHPRQSAPGATNLKYDGESWSVRDPAEPTPASAAYGEAGTPPPFPRARGSVLSFGRYQGWSISQVASHDRGYLEWLQRTQAGRTYRRELDAELNRIAV